MRQLYQWFSVKIGSHRNTLASILKIISFVLYAWNDALSKLLTTTSTHTLPTHTVVFYQYLFSAVLISLVYLFSSSSRQKMTGAPYHICRILLCSCGIILLNWSFTVMPLSYAVGFNLMSPLMTIIGAYVWFRERVTYRKLLALVVSMIAYLVLLDSSRFASATPLSLQACLVPSVALLCFQINTIFTKQLCRLGESSINLTQILFIGIPLVLLPFEINHPHNLTNPQLLIIGAMALNGTLATLALNQAIALADLTFLLPIGFLKYCIVGFFGYVYFLEFPSVNHLFGISLTMIVLYWINQPDRLTLKPAHN